MTSRVGEPEPAWEILAKLAHAWDSAGDEKIPSPRAELWPGSAREYPVFANVQSWMNGRGWYSIILAQKEGDPLFTFAPTRRSHPFDSRSEARDAQGLILSGAFTRLKIRFGAANVSEKTGGQPRPSLVDWTFGNRRALCILRTHPAGLKESLTPDAPRMHRNWVPAKTR